MQLRRFRPPPPKRLNSLDSTLMQMQRDGLRKPLSVRQHARLWRLARPYTSTVQETASHNFKKRDQGDTFRSGKEDMSLIPEDTVMWV
jgi:hypothetical protein